MKLFEIRTLGSSFSFLLGGGQSGGDAPERAIRVGSSRSLDFSLEAESFSEYYLPDFKRGFSALLKCALGYPASEYDVQTPNGDVSVEVRLDGFRTDVALGVPLISEIALRGCTAYRVRVAGAEYVVLPCADCRGVDFHAVRRELIPKEASNSVRAVMAVSGKGEKYRIESMPLCDKLYCADSRAVAACALILKSRRAINTFADFTMPGDRLRCDLSSAHVMTILSEGAGVTRVLARRRSC